MQRLEVSGAVRPIYESLGVKRFMYQTDNGQTSQLMCVVEGNNLPLLRESFGTRKYWQNSDFKRLIIHSSVRFRERATASVGGKDTLNRSQCHADDIRGEMKFIQKENV